MSLKTKIAVAAASVAALGGFGATAAMAAPSAGASTVTCSGCYHIQNVYAFRGALDALHQATAINSPIGLWYETPSTTDPGADMQIVSAGHVSLRGVVNQSNLNWTSYKGDAVVRFKYSPFGNGGADTYIGLQGPNPATQLDVALRQDNPNSIWQEWIVVPVDDHTNAIIASVPNLDLTQYVHHFALVNVGQTTNPDDPYLLTDPQDAVTGSLTQMDLEHADFNQGNVLPTNQLWDVQSHGRQS